MAKRSHYNNSTASRELFEPVFKAEFDVRIIPPTALGVMNPIVLEHIKSVAGLDIEQLPETIVQKYKGADRSYVGATPDQTHADITIAFTLNLDKNTSNYVYKTFRKWSDLQFNPLTGEKTLKDTYAKGSSMVISIFDRVGNNWKQFFAKDFFLAQKLPSIDLSYESNEIWELDVVFRIDVFEDAIK